MQDRNINKGEYQIPKLGRSPGTLGIPGPDGWSSRACDSEPGPPNIALQKIINLTQEDELANVAGLKRSLESKPCPLKGPFAGLFRYCAAPQHTGLSDTSTE